MKKKLGIIVLIVFLALLAGWVMQITQNPKEDEPIIFDAQQFIVAKNQTVSEAELIEKLGNPDKTEEWNYESFGRSYPIRTLFYGTTEYAFNNDFLQRVTLYGNFPYKNKSDFLSLFNLKKYSNTTIKDTNAYYRAYQCGVNDLWLEYNDTEITMAKISYGSIFDQ